MRHVNVIKIKKCVIVMEERCKVLDTKTPPWIDGAVDGTVDGADVGDDHVGADVGTVDGADVGDDHVGVHDARLNFIYARVLVM